MEFRENSCVINYLHAWSPRILLKGKRLWQPEHKAAFYILKIDCALCSKRGHFLIMRCRWKYNAKYEVEMAILNRRTLHALLLTSEALHADARGLGCISVHQLQNMIGDIENGLPSSSFTPLRVRATFKFSILSASHKSSALKQNVAFFRSFPSKIAQIFFGHAFGASNPLVSCGLQNAPKMTLSRGAFDAS